MRQWLTSSYAEILSPTAQKPCQQSLRGEARNYQPGNHRGALYPEMVRLSRSNGLPGASNESANSATIKRPRRFPPNRDPQGRPRAIASPAMDTRQARRKVAKDAMDLLRTRVEAVENLTVLGMAVTEAQHAVTAAQQRLQSARADYAKGYRAATDHGWSTTELRQLGCQPTAPRRSPTPRRTTETAPPTPNTDTPPNTTHTTDPATATPSPQSETVADQFVASPST
jgi:hypothetical protein